MHQLQTQKSRCRGAALLDFLRYRVGQCKLEHPENNQTIFIAQLSCNIVNDDIVKRVN